MESPSLQVSNQMLIEAIEQRIKKLVDPKTLKLIEQMPTSKTVRYIKRIVQK